MRVLVFVCLLLVGCDHSERFLEQDKINVELAIGVYNTKQLVRRLERRLERRYDIKKKTVSAS